MRRILNIVIAVIWLASCAVGPARSPMQAIDNSEKYKPNIVLQDDLLNEPPENPRFIIAQSPTAGAVEQAIEQAIKQQLQHLGYAEAASRDNANVVVWYSYESKQTGMRVVGRATDPWGERLMPLAVTDESRTDLGRIKPMLFSVEFISLQESNFPDLVMRIWQGEWSSSLSETNMAEFTNATLPQVFAQYQSERTQNQIAAFRQARERELQRAIKTYTKLVMYRIQSNWKKPKHHVKGKQCKVKIIQSLVGEIKAHKLLTCDRDRRFRKSIVQAIKASSPLPMPREKEELFDRRELILIFQG